jgi:hypothetical protein
VPSSTGCLPARRPHGRISKTEVGDSMDVPLGPLTELGFCQPDETFITSLDSLRQWLAEMAACGEVVCLDGPATRVQRPRSWANQKMLYDASGTPTPPRAWRCPLCTANCCGPTAAGRAAAMSTSWWRWQAGGCWTRSRWQACWIGVSGHGQGPRALACPGQGPPHHRPTHRHPAGRQPGAGEAAGAGGAGDRPSRQCLGAAPLAGTAAPRPGGVPGRWCALAAGCTGSSRDCTPPTPS